MRNDVWEAIRAGTAIALMLVVVYGVLADHSLQLPIREPAPTSPAHSALASPTPMPTLNSRLPAQRAGVTVTSAAWKNKALTIAFTVRPMAGDYLFEPPFLRTGDMQLPATAASLKAARMALLTLATGGETQTGLVFEETAAWGAGVLVFNPGSTTDSLIAPRVEVTVTWPMTATATPLSAVPRGRLAPCAICPCPSLRDGGPQGAPRSDGAQAAQAAVTP